MRNSFFCFYSGQCMKKIISVIQQKGGVGKTTLAVNLAHLLKELYPKKKVSIADADPQKSASNWINRGLKNGFNGIEISQVAPDSTGKTLKTELGKINSDFIIVDLPPAIEALSLRAALYSDLMLIPVGASVLDMEAAEEAIRVCEEAIELDKKKNFLLIPMKVQGNTIAGKELTKVLENWGPVSKASIGLRVAFPEAALQGCGINHYAKNSAAHKELHKLALETIKLMGVKNG
jgi:chromosome partitioning protein